MHFSKSSASDLRPPPPPSPPCPGQDCLTGFDCNKEQMCHLENFFVFLHLRPAAVLATLASWSSLFTPQQAIVAAEVVFSKDKGAKSSILCGREGEGGGWGGQQKQNLCICFSCENQWARTDGGLFPLYFLLDSDKCPRRPSKADAAQVGEEPTSLFQPQTDGRSSPCSPLPHSPSLLSNKA